MNRRHFVKVTGLVTAGVALVGPKLFAGAAQGRRRLKGPAPINIGPGPLWEKFHYYRQPHLKFRPTDKIEHEVGWHGWLRGVEYGDMIWLTEIDLDEAILADACTLLKEQADDTRHALIRDAKIPCFCAQCKIHSIMSAKFELTGNRLCLSGRLPDYSWSGSIVTLDGKGKGWVRAAENKADKAFSKMVMAMEGPTHGY